MGFLVFSLGGALAAWLTLRNVHGWLAFADDILMGIVAGLLVLVYERWRQRDLEKKLQIIRLMNHHVRNALQIISYSLEGSEQSSAVREAVTRIEWALQEVLPGENELTDAAMLSNPEKSKKETAA